MGHSLLEEEKGRILARLVSLFEAMLSLHKQLAAANSAAQKAIILRQAG